MISKEVLALKKAPLYDDTLDDKNKWYDITQRIIDVYAGKFSSIYNVALSNRPRLHYKFSYKVPHIYRLATVIVNHQFDISLCTERQMQTFLKYLASIEYEIDNDRSLWIEGIPAQSQAALLRKAAIYALNMIVNMNLAVVYSGQERYTYADDFNVLKQVTSGVDSDYKKLKALSWIALIDEKMKSYRLNDILGMEKFNRVKVALVQHTHHISGDFTDRQTDLLLNLLCSRFQNKGCEDVENKPFALKRYVDEMIVTSLGMVYETEEYFSVIEKGLDSLNRYITESNYGYNEYTKRLSSFKSFKKIIDKQSLMMVNVMIDQQSRRITKEQAKVAITGAQDEILRATKKFQSQVPPQMSSTLTRAFTVAVSLVTLGVGALVIAFYNKFYYKKFSLANNQSYTGRLVGKVSESVFPSHAKSSCVNKSALFQPAVMRQQYAENYTGENISLVHDNPMLKPQSGRSAVVH
jgi:hypothetical protein